MDKAQDNDLQQVLIDLFVRNNKDIFSKVKEALNTGDIKLAHRLTHNLKSNAGQLNLISLQKIAKEVEAALKDGENNVTFGQLECLQMELETAITEFTPLVSEPEKPEVSQMLDNKTALKILDELEPLLFYGNPECLSYISSIQLIPGSDELIKMIEDFSFDLALEILEEIRKNLNNNPC